MKGWLRNVLILVLVGFGVLALVSSWEPGQPDIRAARVNPPVAAIGAVSLAGAWLLYKLKKD